MEESGSHQPTIGPRQGNSNPHQAESKGSQHSQSEVNPQQMGDHEKSGQTVHPNRSQSRGKVMCPMQRMRKTCNVRLTGEEEVAPCTAKAVII